MGAADLLDAALEERQAGWQGAYDAVTAAANELDRKHYELVSAMRNAPAARFSILDGQAAALNEQRKGITLALRAITDARWAK